jgi:hypothetical protein
VSTCSLSKQGMAYPYHISRYGWCGGTTAHCGAGCQPEFGACNNVTAPVFKASPNARCGIISGATGGYNCLGSEWGDCCSRYVKFYVDLMGQVLMSLTDSAGADQHWAIAVLIVKLALAGATANLPRQ